MKTTCFALFASLIASLVTPAQAGFVDGMNTYAAYHVMRGGVDPTGLYLQKYPERGDFGRADTFWNIWTQQQRKDWFQDFDDTFGGAINRTARKHCIPKELLSAIIANEQIDYSKLEYDIEMNKGLGMGNSFGPAQITGETLVREEITTTQENWWIRNSSLDAFSRTRLTDAEYNIEAAGRLLSNYLDKMCRAAKNGQMSQSFQKDVAPGCNVSDFCCKAGRNCDELINLDVPKCLIQAAASVWNNGPKLIGINDIRSESPNGWAHGQHAGLLNGAFTNE